MKLTKEQIEAITSAIGHASVCWNPIPKKSVFDSFEAIKVRDQLVKYLEETLECPLCKELSEKAW